MRFFIASMIVCCAAVGYSQESETLPAEVTTTEEGSGDVAVGTNSNKADQPTTGGCGCGTKPKT